MKHKHEWIESMREYDQLMCAKSGCKAILEIAEIERRCNATECLSADDAEGLSNLTMGMQKEVWDNGGDPVGMRFWKEQTKMLRDYAKALRGE